MDVRSDDNLSSNSFALFCAFSILNEKYSLQSIKTGMYWLNFFDRLLGIFADRILEAHCARGSNMHDLP